MTEEQKDTLRKVLHGALEQFQMIDYLLMVHILAALCAAMLVAWGLNDKQGSRQAADIMNEMQQYIVLISPLEESGLQA